MSKSILNKKYGYAVIKGALRAIPVAGHVIEEVLKVAEDEVSKAIDDEKPEICESLKTLNVQFKKTNGSSASTDTLEVVGKSVFQLLSEEDQSYFETSVKEAYLESGSGVNKAAQKTVSELFEKIVRHSDFSKAVSSALEVVPSSKDESSYSDILGSVIDDRFQIIEEIGRGGFGVVYEALDKLHGTKCAVKLMRTANIEHIHRFKREAKMAFALGKASGIVRVYHKGRLGDFGAYVVMDLVVGARPIDLYNGSFEQRIERFVKACKILKQVHDEGIIHRDLKPGNFLQDGNGKIYLSDFGLAKYLRESSEATRHDYTMLSVSGAQGMRGTPAYMPPEQFADFNKVDKRADIYAMGVMLFEIISGKRPFKGSDPSSIMRAQMAIELGREDKPDPGNDCDSRIRGLCLKMIELDQDKRAECIRQVIETITGKETISVSTAEALEMLDSGMSQSTPKKPIGQHIQFGRSYPSYPDPLWGREIARHVSHPSHMSRHRRNLEIKPQIRESPSPVWDTRSIDLFNPRDTVFFIYNEHSSHVCNLDQGGVLSLHNQVYFKTIKLRIDSLQGDKELIDALLNFAIFRVFVSRSEVTSFTTFACEKTGDFEYKFDCGKVMVGACEDFRIKAEFDSWEVQQATSKILEKSTKTDHVNAYGEPQMDRYRNIKILLDTVNIETIS